MSESKEDSRRTAVVKEAFNAFVTYGYKRTTMDDIASAANMSRPALYLLYRNKSEIFRACMIFLMGEMRAEVGRCVTGEHPVADEIKAALDAAIVAPYARIMETPHGPELFDLKTEHAADLFLEWIATVEGEIAKGLSAAEAAGRIDIASTGLSPERLAALLLDGVEGAKMRMTSIDDLVAKLSDLVDLMIRPLLR